MRTAESVVLTLWPPGPLERNTSTWRSLSSTSHLDLVGLRQHEHGGRRRVDAALALGHRHPLHPVRATLVLEQRPGVGALHGERDLVDAAEVAGIERQGVDLQPMAGGVGPVHVVQVAGEEVGLLAALGAADLDDDVAPGMGVGRDHQLAQLLADGGQLGRHRASSSSARSRSSPADSATISRAVSASAASWRWRRAASTTGSSWR